MKFSKEEIIEMAQRSSLTNEIMSFHYKGSGDIDYRIRHVIVWEVYNENGYTYINGFDAEQEDERTFRADRIGGYTTEPKTKENSVFESVIEKIEKGTAKIENYNNNFSWRKHIKSCIPLMVWISPITIFLGIAIGSSMIEKIIIAVLFTVVIAFNLGMLRDLLKKIVGKFK